MSTVIIIDSACEIPEKFTQSKSIRVLPMNVTLGDEQSLDTFTTRDTLNMLKSGSISAKVYVNSDAPTIEQITDYMREEILPNYDWAIVETISGKQSEMFDRWTKVSQAMSPHYKRYRSPGAKQFQLSLIDSQTSYSGQGLLALETIRLTKQKFTNRRDLLQAIKSFTPYIQSYAVTPDIGYLRQRAVQRGDNTVNYLSTLLGKMMKVTPIVHGTRGEVGMSAAIRGVDKAVDHMFNHFIDAIHKGLLVSPLINISYVGELEELNQYQGYLDLRDAAAENGIKVFTSESRLLTALYLGPGTVAISGGIKDQNFVITDSNKK